MVEFAEATSYQDREKLRLAQLERGRERLRTKAKRRFRGFDGEGWDVNGKHELMILRAGDSELYTGKPLFIADVFDWMVQLPRTETYYVGFSLGYDLSMILGQLPRERFLRLYDRESRVTNTRGFVTLPVDWRDTYRMDWIPGKRFSVWLADDPRKRFDVEDVVGCFQKSFLAAIRDWKVGTPEELALIERFKGLRGEFENVPVDEVREYNRLECVLLAEMMDRVRRSASDAEIFPSSWFGAGQLAQAMMRSRRVKDTMRKESYPDAFNEAAERAYFGGWFDTSAVGIFPEVYEYDISSAYPHAMRTLPCLAHARLTHGAVEGAEQLCYVSWMPRDLRHTVSWGAFPIRHGSGERSEPREGRRIFVPGTLWYPRKGEGWYWRREVDAVCRRGDYIVTVHDTWSLVPQCTCRPFSWVDGVYQERKRIGKSGRGMVLKLAMNSLYGKLAQSVGTPQFASAVWAGLVTSTTRSMLHDAIRAAGGIGGRQSNVLMVATDAVYTRKPIPDGMLNVGEGLGQWETAEHGRYMIVQPGLHYAYETDKFKTRGIPRSVVAEGVTALERHWFSEDRWEPFTFTLEMFYTPQYAYQLRSPELMGQWVQVPRGIHFGSKDKRVIPRRGNEMRSDSVRLRLLSNDAGYTSASRKATAPAVAEMRRDEPWENLADSQRDFVDPVECVVSFSD